MFWLINKFGRVAIIATLFLFGSIKNNSIFATMKTIKLTNEQAAALYLKDPELRTTLLHDFTDEELGIKAKPLRWEDLEATHCITGYFSYPCTEDYSKAYAHTKLIQFAKYYNKCDQHEIGSFYFVASYKTESKTIEPHGLTGENIYGSQVKFRNKSDLEKCIEDNLDLWIIYVGVK